MRDEMKSLRNMEMRHSLLQDGNVANINRKDISTHQESIELLQSTDNEMIPAGKACLARCGNLLAVGGDYRAAIGRSDRLFYCYIQNENIRHFE